MTPDRRTRQDDPVASVDEQPESAASGRLVARVEETDGGSECTLFPADAEGEELVTTWMTASEDSFVELADCR
jgi:hypothetical protein